MEFCNTLRPSANPRGRPIAGAGELLTQGWPSQPAPSRRFAPKARPGLGSLGTPANSSSVQHNPRFCTLQGWSAPAGLRVLFYHVPPRKKSLPQPDAGFQKSL